MIDQKTKDQATNEMFQRMMAFVEVADGVCEKCDTIYTFVCPICQGEAKAIKTSYNGHLRAKCDSCGYAMMQ